MCLRTQPLAMLLTDVPAASGTVTLAVCVLQLTFMFYATRFGQPMTLHTAAVLGGV